MAEKMQWEKLLSKEPLYLGEIKEPSWAKEPDWEKIKKNKETRMRKYEQFRQEWDDLPDWKKYMPEWAWIEVIEPEGSDNRKHKLTISPYMIDYQKIVSSAAFRRLQDKTQVYSLDQSDFIRTRLTHSMEVSNIARQIGEILGTEGYGSYYTKFHEDEVKDIRENLSEITEVLACAGLLHDIGNPPFGHYGEEAIKEWFNDYFEKDSFKNTLKEKNFGELTDAQKMDFTNFEGNAQAIRILSKVYYNNAAYDTNLTLAVLNTLIKYPCPSDLDKEDDKYKDEETGKLKHIYSKMGYYQAEREIVDRIISAAGTGKEGDITFNRHPLTFIMEAADDIAYNTADLEDGLKKGLFTLQEFIDYINDERPKTLKKKLKKELQETALTKEEKEKKINDVYDFVKRKYRIFESLIDHWESNKNKVNPESELQIFQKWMNEARGWLMYSAAYIFAKRLPEIMSGEYTEELNSDKDNNNDIAMDVMSSFAFKHCYRAKEVMKKELSNGKIIKGLLDDFIPAVVVYPTSKNEKKDKPKEYRLCEMISKNYVKDYEIRAKMLDEELHAKLEAMTDEEQEERKQEIEDKKKEIEREKLYHRFLMVTDFISGMTDSYAKNLYQELNGF